MINIGTVSKEQNLEKNISRLFCEIDIDGLKTKAWYEVEEKYSSYLCDDRCDAFLIAALPWALKNGHDIVLSCNVTQELYDQIVSLLLPILLKKMKDYKTCIKIYKSNKSLGLEPVCGGSAVGMGISCGVDSFYTYYFSKNNFSENYQITHLTYLNVGSHRDELHGDEANKLFLARQKNAKTFAVEEEKEFLPINSNIGDVFAMPHIQSHSYRSASAILALQKLFKVYYYSAGVKWEELEFVSECAHYDVYLLPLLSTRACTIYSIGGEAERFEKVSAITSYAKTYAHLDVCLHEAHNCTSCEKCIRTLLTLWILGKEKLYKDSFDLNLFYKNLDQYILYAMARAKNDSSYNEIIKKANENGLISLKLKLHYIVRTCKNYFVKK